MTRIYRAMWWPMRTRRERWIWRYGYLIGTATGAFNAWRIMKARHGQ